MNNFWENLEQDLKFKKVDKKVVSTYMKESDYNFLVEYSKRNNFKSLSSLIHFIIIQFINDLAKKEK